MVHSLNIPIIQLGLRVGPAKVAEMGHRLGLLSDLRPVPALMLGASEVTLVELTASYAAFADHGLSHAPYCVERIVDKDGSVLAQGTPKSERAISEETAALITEMLKAVVAEGTGSAVRRLGVVSPVAGKTGTSENYQDAWFIGYTPHLVTGVWVGFDLPKSLGSSASGIAVPIWAAFMKRAETYGTQDDFTVPSTIRWETIDVETGGLARAGCIKRKKLPFAEGHIPAECALHKSGLFGFFQRWRGKK